MAGGAASWSSFPLLAALISAAFLFDVGESGAPHTVVDPQWHQATATWYGSADGDGSDGGACGYGSLVDVAPMKARVGVVSPAVFKAGEGCGACYKVRCLDRGVCSRRAVTVIVTDECPGGYCAQGRIHFDLSGAAFGRLAVAGHGGQLRDRGEISVVFRRTPCKYRGKNIAFRVVEGSTSFWLSLLVEFEDGDGDIGSMQLTKALYSAASSCLGHAPLHISPLP
nr:expansin B16 [Lolium arundinaceum]